MNAPADGPTRTRALPVLLGRVGRRYGTPTKSSMNDRAVSVSVRNAQETELHRPVSPSATATTTLELPVHFLD